MLLCCVLSLWEVCWYVCFWFVFGVCRCEVCGVFVCVGCWLVCVCVWNIGVCCGYVFVCVWTVGVFYVGFVYDCVAFVHVCVFLECFAVCLFG